MAMWVHHIFHTTQSMRSSGVELQGRPFALRCMPRTVLESGRASRDDSTRNSYWGNTASFTAQFADPTTEVGASRYHH